MQRLAVDDEIILCGVSQKGKSRIAQYGEFWRIQVIAFMEGKQAILVWSLNGGDRRDKRWILVENDKDFAIAKQEEENG